MITVVTTGGGSEGQGQNNVCITYIIYDFKKCNIRISIFIYDIVRKFKKKG